MTEWGWTQVYGVMQSYANKTSISFSICALIIFMILLPVQMKWNVQSKWRQSIKESTSVLSSHLPQPCGYVRHCAAERLITQCWPEPARLYFLLLVSFRASSVYWLLNYVSLLPFFINSKSSLLPFPTTHIDFSVLFYFFHRGMKWSNKQNNEVAWGRRRQTTRCRLGQSQYSLVCVLCLVPRAPALMTTCWLRSWPPGPASRSKISSKSTRKVEDEDKTKARRFNHLDHFLIIALCMLHAG